MDKKVSIIIPVYNVEKYLRQCLDSVINQTFKDIEIIIVNDCSPDNSLQIIKEYQQKDERIVLLDLKQNIGLAFARNAGMKIAKGKYITFIDSDDWVIEDYIEILYNNIELYKTEVVIAENLEYDNISDCVINKSQKLKFYNKIIKDIKDKKNLILFIPRLIIQAMIVSRKFIVEKNILFQKEKIGEDLLFIVEIIASNSSLLYIDYPIYYYRVNRENSLMTNFYKNKNLDYITLFTFFNKIMDRFKQQNTFEVYKKELCVYLFLYFSREVTDKQLTIEEYFKAVKLYKKNFYQRNFCFLKVKNIKNKIRLIVFTLSLKLNMNYMKIWNFIRKFKY